MLPLHSIHTPASEDIAASCTASKQLGVIQRGQQHLCIKAVVFRQSFTSNIRVRINPPAFRERFIIRILDD